MSSKKTKKKTSTQKKIIHQVYGMFDDGIPLKDIPVFYENVKKTRAFCKKNNIQHKLWNLKQANNLIQKHFKQYTQLWNDFKVPIQKADFIRYCILYKYGGIYIDCDIHPIDKSNTHINKLFQKDFFFVTWDDDKKFKPYNAVLGTKKNNPLYEDILKHCQESFYEKSKNDIYKKWKGRYIFHTTGHYMLLRVLKKNNVYNKKYILNIMKVYHSKSNRIIQGSNPIFEDSNASTWFEGKDISKKNN